MDLDFNYFSWILFFNFIIAAGISVFSFLKGYSRSHLYFTLMMLMIAEWSLAATIESAATTIASKILWSQIEYIGACATAVFFLKYAFGFAKSRSQRFRKNFFVFWIVPAAIVLLVFTNRFHHLVWLGFNWSLAGDNILTYVHGPAFFVMIAYSLGLVLVGIAFIVTSLPSMPLAFRSQAKSVLAASVFPFIATFIYSVGLTPVEGLDITVISFVVTGLVLLFGISRYNIFSILPLARSKITEKMHEGVVITDAEYKIIFYNPAAKKMLNLNNDLHFTDLRETEWLYNHCISSNNEPEIETELQMGGNTGRWFSVSVISVGKDHDSTKGNLIVLRDITNRKTLETEARNLISELHQSQKELRELNSQKDKLMSIIAHDLRTPFHQILSFARMLSEDFEVFTREEIKSMAEGILQAGEQGAVILEDLLSWARTQRNTTEVTPSEISPASLLEEIIPVFAIPARDKQLKISVNGDTEALVIANRNMAGIVFRNLIANALKFSRQGSEIQLNIKKGVDFHLIEVRDFGIGIPENDLPKLFNIDIKYTRNGTSGEPGTGLGLILCKDLVTRNKGELTVFSIQGEGSTFTVKLPAYIP
ncbi:MAG: histidine kinase N-terminal 7TM domain-containing protein [Lentimicrobium sp.]